MSDVGCTAILGERLLFFHDFAFELSNAPFELFNRTIELLDGSVDVVAENFRTSAISCMRAPFRVNSLCNGGIHRFCFGVL
jgi:hypothetical protein